MFPQLSETETIEAMDSLRAGDLFVDISEGERVIVVVVSPEEMGAVIIPATGAMRVAVFKPVEDFRKRCRFQTASLGYRVRLYSRGNNVGEYRSLFPGSGGGWIETRNYIGIGNPFGP